VMLEGWSLGLPSVTLAVNPSGLLTADRLGICAGGDPRVMAAAIVALLEESAARAAMGRRCRASRRARPCPVASGRGVRRLVSQALPRPWRPPGRAFDDRFAPSLRSDDTGRQRNVGLLSVTIAAKSRHQDLAMGATRHRPGHRRGHGIRIERSHRPSPPRSTRVPAFRVQMSFPASRRRIHGAVHRLRLARHLRPAHRLYALTSAIHCLTGSEHRVVGPACTVKVYPGDNLMVHKSLDIVEPGDVVVVDAGASRMNAALGSLSRPRRDIAASPPSSSTGTCATCPRSCPLDFPVFARGTTPIGPLHRGPGEINYPICCGGVVSTRATSSSPTDSAWSSCRATTRSISSSASRPIRRRTASTSPASRKASSRTNGSTTCSTRPAASSRPDRRLRDDGLCDFPVPAHSGRMLQGA